MLRCGRSLVHPLGRQFAPRATLRRRALPELSRDVDAELSKRPLELDEAGYYIVKLDTEAREIVAQYYTNTLNRDGVHARHGGTTRYFACYQMCDWPCSERSCAR